MKKLNLLCVLALIVSLLSGCAEVNRVPTPSASPVVDRILSSGELRVGMSGDMPPLNMTTKEGKVIGLDADLAALVADAMGVKLNVQKMEFAGLLPALEAGRIDMIISNMTMTPDRNLKVAFVGPYFTSGKGLLTKRSTLAEVKKMEDLNNPAFTFVALKGSTSEAVTKAGAPKAKLIAVASENEGVQMVLDGKADGMLADFPICAVAAYRYPGSGPRVGRGPHHLRADRVRRAQGGPPPGQPAAEPAERPREGRVHERAGREVVRQADLDRPA